MSTPPVIPAFDLTQRPPRSPHVRLGGFVVLPRILDKGRAHLAGKAGAYIYHSGLDKRFFSFVGINSDALLDQLARGLGDGEIRAWITTHAGHKPSDWEIAGWSHTFEGRTATTLKAREHYDSARDRWRDRSGAICASITIDDVIDRDRWWDRS